MLGKLHISLSQMGFPLSDISLPCQAGYVAPTLPWLAFSGLAMPLVQGCKRCITFSMTGLSPLFYNWAPQELQSSSTCVDTGH